MRTQVRPAVTTVVVAGVVVLCAVGSPLVLSITDGWWHPDWRRLADIGQAYGAASAALSALAVVGVAAGLGYQGRQLRLARIQATRDKHERLLMLAIQDPDAYGVMFGPEFATMPATQLRRSFFCVMALNYFKLAYEAGTLSEQNLRTEALPAYFASADSRRQWESSADDWLAERSPKAARRFAEIADDEYRKAIAAGPPVSEPVPAPPAPPGRRQAGVTPVVLGAAVTAAVAIGWLIGRRR
ncbi:DUF6082 family protein [Dactylosporangium sp. AC04546]|uniref:DUF6082 family protein n=1 Tax=Dactylosporangium sp. AC04546 TaxID=2862460 RepID=UPI001EE08A05|nr:DUF6082 family protein [Dactylosporangium sp. AC04546]WVK89314.1 DUF6082 family protein [Dactylosporangium sp. AC04546]